MKQEKPYKKTSTWNMVVIVCPFCDLTQTAYNWELIGEGVTCKCGAKHNDSGNSTKETVCI